MAQQFDTTGKDSLNECINEIAKSVLNVEKFMQESSFFQGRLTKVKY